MDFAFAYLIKRFVVRIFEFFEHWYAGGFRAIKGKLLTGKGFVRVIEIAFVGLFCLIWYAIPLAIIFYAFRSI